MLKIRLQGTTYDIKWFIRLLSRDDRFWLAEPSDILDNKGSVKYKRLYAEVYRDPEEFHRRKMEEEGKKYYGTGTVFVGKSRCKRDNTAERRNEKWNVR